MLAIAWQYLSGRVVAADPSDHGQPEWPPHPDRVFQAMVAAWGERGQSPEEKTVLEWLETLPPPQLSAPEISGNERQVSTIFVPVNDIQGPGRGEYAEKHLSLLPASQIRRKERSISTVHLGSETVTALLWTDAILPGKHRQALESLCAAVTHVGHSRSLVRMWVENSPPPATWEPVTGQRGRELSLRIPHAGRLAALIQAYANGGEGWKRPPTALWHGYARALAASADAPGSCFDPRLIVLRKIASDGNPGLIQAPAFVNALRNALMSKADDRALPWISGHQPDGKPFDRTHVAFLPLAHVGHEHADGHLLGMAIALPREIAPEDEQSVLDALVCVMNPETGELRLKAGELGTMDLVEDDRPLPPQALRPVSWTDPSTCWGTVTPIALDRLPPRRHEGDDAWVAAQLVAACVRQGLPEPCEICILPVSPFTGAPTCRAFAPLLRKPDGARRWHVHAQLRFSCPVTGPIVLGAGRYQGYGLCKPLAERNNS